MSQNFDEIIDYSKTFSGLTPELETCLKTAAPVIVPHLDIIITSCYSHLLVIPTTAEFLEGHRLEDLHFTHVRWLTSLFTQDIDAKFAETMYRVGEVHVGVNLPVEFMAGAMTLVNDRMVQVVLIELQHSSEQCLKTLLAINAVTGLALMLMQQSYHRATIAQEFGKFLNIAGMSRKSFSNLAKARAYG